MPAPLHIYMHWPWCQQKCPYCDFNSHAQPAGGVGDGLKSRYLHQLEAEARWWQGQIAPQRPLASVFIGGGTPSLMQPADVAKWLDVARSLGLWQPETEVTLEANPASLKERQAEDYFKALKDVGVTRVSLGVQGLNAEKLAFLGRLHGVEEALHSLRMAQNAGLRVNADVIYGLPGQTLADWRPQLVALATMGLSHISAYQLTIEPQTAFWGQVKRGEWQPVDGDTEADFFEATAQILTANGYQNYEISNFCRPGQACRHNLGVWRGEDYIGLGAGAHGGVHLANGTWVRTATRKHPDAYLAYTPQNGLTNHFAQWLTPSPAQQVQDALFAGLRLKEGVALGALRKTHGNTVLESAIDMTVLALFEQKKWLQRPGEGHTEHLALTETGWPLLSGLLGELLPPLGPV